MTTCSDEGGANESSQGASPSSRAPLIVPIAGSSQRLGEAQSMASSPDSVSLSHIHVNCPDTLLSIQGAHACVDRNVVVVEFWFLNELLS